MNFWAITKIFHTNVVNRPKSTYLKGFLQKVKILMIMGFPFRAKKRPYSNLFYGEIRQRQDKEISEDFNNRNYSNGWYIYTYITTYSTHLTILSVTTKNTQLWYCFIGPPSLSMTHASLGRNRSMALCTESMTIERDQTWIIRLFSCSRVLNGSLTPS